MNVLTKAANEVAERYETVVIVATTESGECHVHHHGDPEKTLPGLLRHAHGVALDVQRGMTDAREKAAMAEAA